MMRRYWLPLAGSLVVLWLGAWGVRSWLQSLRPTAASVEQLVKTTDLTPLTPAERRKRLDDLASRFNRLTYEERRKVRSGRADNQLFEQMTREERERFVEQTLPTGMKQMVEALNKMTREERQKLVTKALEDLKTGGDRPNPEAADQEASNKIVDLGLKTYLNESTAETKMDLAPLLDAMQARIQERRR